MTSSNPGEGSLRLVGGATNNTGVVQVYLSGTWVGICANGLRYDSESLDVACRQLGYRSWHSAGSVFTYNFNALELLLHHYCSNKICSNVYACIHTYNIVVLYDIAIYIRNCILYKWWKHLYFSSIVCVSPTDCIGYNSMGTAQHEAHIPVHMRTIWCKNIKWVYMNVTNSMTSE